MSQESYSLDVGESLEKERKADSQLEEQKKAKEALEKKEIEQKEKEHEENKTETKKTNIQSFLTKYRKFIIIALILFIIAVNVYIRVFALSAPGIDQRIESNYEASLKEDIANKIKKEHVGLLDQALLQKEVDVYFKQVWEKPETKRALQKLINEYKQNYLDANGNIYFINSDPFLYLRYARNIIRHGSSGETKDGVQYDYLRIAPYGSVIIFNLMQYYEAYLYKILHLFDSKIQLERAALYVPILFSALSVLLAFIIIARLTNIYGGFVGGLLFAIHPRIFTSTNVDTQIPSLFFTMLTIWLALELTYAKKFSIRFWILIVASLLTLVLYKCTWQGYYYIYFVIASYVVFYLFLLFIKKRLRKEKINKKYLLGVLACIIAAIVSLALRPKLIDHILSRLNIGERIEFFPTAYFMVSELQRTTLAYLIQTMGGYTIFAAAIISIACLIYISFKNKLEGNTKYYLFVVYWFVALMVVTLLAQRFVIYFCPPFVISIGIGAGLLYPYIGKLPRTLGFNDKKYIKPAIGILLIILMIFVIKEPIQKKIYSVPTTIDDALHDIAIDMKSSSKSNAIINTWWDDGYLLEYYAERPVLFDGGSFNSPALYWLSKAFMSTDSNYSINVLRMLDCGVDPVFNRISAKKGGPVAIDIINEVLAAGKAKSKEILKKEKLDANLLDLVFCKPPEAFLMVSEIMAKMHYQYETVASWDFKLNEIKSKIKGMYTKEAIDFLENEYSISTEDAYETYGKIYSDSTSAAPSKIEFFDAPCAVLKDGINCRGLILDFKTNITKDAKGQVFPYYYVTESNGTHVAKNLNVDSKLTIIFYQQQDLMHVAAVDSSIRDSFLVKTYFLDAYDIPQLELISSRSTVLGNKVKAYKINWAN